MKQKQRHRESPGKGAASANQKARTPMDCFKGLTRQLLGVSREQLREEEKKYQHARSKKPHL
jgi:hypothetical protein